jgi:hypothetical protein
MMKSMQLPSTPRPTPAAPAIIEGKQTLKAVLTFYPILEENKKTGKVKATLPLPQENSIRLVFGQSIALLANCLTDVLKNKPGAREKAGRLVNWARGLPAQEIASWREHGRFVGQQYLNEQNLAAPRIKWAAVTICCYYADYIARDSYSLDEKEVFDGLADAGFFINDSGIIDFRIIKGGIDAANPRYEVFIYEVELAPEQEALLVKTEAVKKPRSRKKAA